MSLYEPASVRSLFDEMSATYGLVNLISSFGFAAHWRHLAVKDLSIAPSSHVVDLMSGMSELCRSVARCLPMPSHVTGVDISPQMIGRAKREWPFPLELVLADVLIGKQTTAFWASTRALLATARISPPALAAWDCR